jgi:hypothetical protein
MVIVCEGCILVCTLRQIPYQNTNQRLVIVCEGYIPTNLWFEASGLNMTHRITAKSPQGEALRGR